MDEADGLDANLLGTQISVVVPFCAEEEADTMQQHWRACASK